MASSDLEKQLANLSPAKKALLERKRRESGAAPVLRRIENRDGIPLSFAQQRFWLIHELDPTSYLYNVPRAVRLTGNLDRAALESSSERGHQASRSPANHLPNGVRSAGTGGCTGTADWVAGD